MGTSPPQGFDTEKLKTSDTEPQNPDVGIWWLDTSADPPELHVYADLGGGGDWHELSFIKRVYDNLDSKVSDAGATQTDIEDGVDSSDAGTRVRNNLDTKVSDAPLTTTEVENSVDNSSSGSRVLSNLDKAISNLNDIAQGDILSDATPFQGDYIDKRISNVGSSTNTESLVKNHDLRFVREMSRLFFDRSMGELNYSDGIFDVFVDGDKVSYGSPEPYYEYGSNGFLSLGADWNIQEEVVVNSATISGSGNKSVFWKPDGTKMFATDASNGVINEYEASTPWDVTSLTLMESINMQDSDAEAMYWKPDGTKLFTADSVTDTVYQYDVSTPWNITTASQSSSFVPSYAEPYSMEFKPDGTKMYIYLHGATRVIQYNLSTDWDITTTTEDGSYSIGASGMVFQSDGSHIITSDYDSNYIRKTPLTTDWDLSTADTNNIVTTTMQEADNTGLFIRGDGLKEYQLYDDNIYEVNLVYNQTLTATWSFSLGFTPVNVVISDTTEGNLEVSYTITDSNGNSVTVSDSDVDNEIDTSNFANGDLTIDADLDATSPTLSDKFFDFGAYFN